MSSAHLLRLQIEAALAPRIPSALTPAPRVIRPTAPTGVEALDNELQGGLPLGAITELAGPECSGRTSLALSFVAGMTQAGRVCAWIDVSDCLDPESAAAAGVDLERLLWIRCGVEPWQKMRPEFGERGETTAPASQAVMMSRPAKPLPGVDAAEAMHSMDPRCAQPRPRRPRRREAVPVVPLTPSPAASPLQRATKPWSRLDQALRAADLLLMAGGFSALVLDMGSIAPEFALRVPLATWFRYRAAAERTQAAVLLLNQQTCAKSSAGLVLHLAPGPRQDAGGTVLTGAEYRVRIARERFGPVTPFGRKPPQSEKGLRWQAESRGAVRL